MTFAGLIEQLTSLPDQAGQSAWLRARLREWDPEQTGAFGENPF